MYIEAGKEYIIGKRNDPNNLRTVKVTCINVDTYVPYVEYEDSEGKKSIAALENFRQWASDRTR